MNGNTSIPVIDLHKAYEEVVAAVREACINEGFFYLINHDVDEEMIARVFEQSIRFFSLPVEKKMTCEVNESHHGYTCMGETTLNPAKQSCADTKEGYFIVADRDPTSLAAVKDQIFHRPSVWPDEELLGIPGWRKIMTEYFEVMSKLSYRMVTILAQALGQPPDFFETSFRDPLAALRLLHYTATKSVPEAGVFAAGEHTDYGVLTLLKTDSVPGLQAKLKDGTWLDVKPLKGAFIVNLGDMLQRWTNDFFRSPPHRVVNSSEKDRYSMPFVYRPDYDALLECIPSCCSEDNPPHYPPMQCSERLLSRYREAHRDFKH